MLALAVILFFGFLTLFGDEGLLKLKRLYALRTQIRHENQDLFKANQKLLQEAQLLKQNVVAERMIREKLGYVKPNEYILLLDDPPVAESKPATQMTSHIPAAQD